VKVHFWGLLWLSFGFVLVSGRAERDYSKKSSYLAVKPFVWIGFVLASSRAERHYSKKSSYLAFGPFVWTWAVSHFVVKFSGGACCQQQLGYWVHYGEAILQILAIVRLVLA